jgi:hypothetical protein
MRTVALSTLKKGEEFRLRLHAQELRHFVESLVPLYRFYEQEGVPGGSKTFVQVDSSLAKFVSLGEKDLASFVQSKPDDATGLLLRLVKWLATSPGCREAASRIAAMAPEQMPAFTALLGLAAVKSGLTYWRENRSNSSEEFWQQALATRAYVLGQAFAYPIVIIGSKTYVGGKQITMNAGKEVDFLATIQSTQSVLLIEIKTPQTKLLGPAYREGVFPLSRELSGAVAQALRYRQTLARTFDTATSELSWRLTLGEPRCVVIAGNSSELQDQPMKENFELQREQIRGVTVLTYDELFNRLAQLVALLEGDEPPEPACRPGSGR